jgi:hypothetical protein
LKIAHVLITHAEMQVATTILPNYGSSHVIKAPEPVISAFKECSVALRGLWLIFKEMLRLCIKISHDNLHYNFTIHSFLLICCQYPLKFRVRLNRLIAYKDGVWTVSDGLCSHVCKAGNGRLGAFVKIPLWWKTSKYYIF